MKIICSQSEQYLESRRDADLCVLLFDRPTNMKFASCGAPIKKVFKKKKILLLEDAWDFLSLSLSIAACDFGASRKNSPDGWTRHLDVEIAVNNPKKYNEQIELIQKFLSFLSTDIWRVSFVKQSFSQHQTDPQDKVDATCVSLISGGLDSLIGAIDLVEKNETPLFVSQIVPGDRQKQTDFVKHLSSSLMHMQINHSFRSPLKLEPSQRARSIIFLSYGVIASTLLKKYPKSRIKMYVCENGLISINPPLTEARIGSLSTRTTHPYFLSMLQSLLDNLQFNVEIKNPYQFKTKGQMLSECKNQTTLKRLAHLSTSCGRFARNGFNHCGRCVPCLIRRSSFLPWSSKDKTDYVFANLGLDDPQHSGFDDVRSALLALHSIKNTSFNAWLGSALAPLAESERRKLRPVVKKGMKELKKLFEVYKLF